MSNNDLSSKLAKGMRRAKEPGPAASSTSATAPAAASNVAIQPQGGANTSAGPRPSGKRFAEQGDQTPPASLDRPWENLHPKRIWPD